jgi:flavin reductase (DIM6/NTAB) family NADH-FMN oxidoreductase RutF
VTIHTGHPFATPEPERNPLRRWRGRTVAPVSVWAAGDGVGRVGWTLSSFLVADGEPPEALGLLDEDSALADRLRAVDPVRRGALAVNLLGWSHRGLADAFAGIAPAPGGPFTLGAWESSDWGPVLADAPGWLGVRLVGEPQPAGWSLLVRVVVEHVEIGPEPPDGMLSYLRGRYRAVSL